MINNKTKKILGKVSWKARYQDKIESPHRVTQKNYNYVPRMLWKGPPSACL